MKFLGISINRERKEELARSVSTFIPPTNYDGAIVIDAEMSGANAFRSQHTLSMDADVSSESELINVYRTISVYPEIDWAVNQIIGDMIINNDEGDVVTPNLDDVPFDQNIKDIILEEFQYILRLLRFRSEGTDIARQWYVDSRLVYQKVIDNDHPEEGIKELRKIDPRCIRKIREVKVLANQNGHDNYTVEDEYFIYYPRPFLRDDKMGGGWNVTLNGQMPHSLARQVVQIEPESIAYISSGLIDHSSGMIYGFLQKCIKIFNQLRNMEDSAVIYRLTRAPERRVIYIDTGNMSGQKAQTYIQQMQAAYRVKQQYDAKTGQLRNDNRIMSVQEDIWLPRKEGSSGTQIDTLQGASNLDSIEDMRYFRDKLFRSLNVPMTRFSDQNQGLVLGNEREISRDELDFAKFIDRLQGRFSYLFSDILKTQLVLKGVVTEEEFDEHLADIPYRYSKDSYYEEVRETEMFKYRMEAVDMIEPHIGKLTSETEVRKRIMRQTDEDIKRIDNEIQAEKEERAKEEEERMKKFALDDPDTNTDQKVPNADQSDDENDNVVRLNYENETLDDEIDLLDRPNDE